MTGLVALVALAAGLAAALLLPDRADRADRSVLVGPARDAPLAPTPSGSDPGTMRRHRAALALLAGAGAWTFLGGTVGLLAGPVAAVVAWVAISRAESPQARRERDVVRRELPHVVTLLAAALRAGATPTEALRLVCRALPGVASARLEPAVARLELGADPVEVWSSFGAGSGLAPLGRTLARSHATGAPVVASVERLAEQLAREGRGEVEDRARAVGVKAAIPLGLCLLPSFLLIGIVPLVAGLLGSFRW